MSWTATRVAVSGGLSDLYDNPYAPNETILTLTVTSTSITAKLLGRTKDGSYVPLSGITIHIYELVNQAWSPIGDFDTNSDGVVFISGTNTQEWYKAVFDGTDEYLPAVAYAQLQPQPQEQPPPPSPQPSQQPEQVLTVTVCRTSLWLWLLLLALLLERRKEEEVSV